LAAAINDDANYNSTLTTALATKLPLAGGTMTGNILHNDSVKGIYGTGSDLQIFHDGNNSFINNTGGNAGNLSIKSSGINLMSAASETYATFVADGAATLYHSNVAKINTTSTGLNVTGNITTSTTLSSFYDRIKIVNGSAQINIGQWDTVNHRIETDANRPFKIYSYNTSGGIALGISGADKLTILGDGSGITVAGNVAMTTGAASGKFAVMNATVHGSYDFYNNGTTYLNGSAIIDASLDLTSSAGALMVGGTTVIDNNRRFLAADGAVNVPYYTFAADTDTGLWRPASNTIALSTAGAERMSITSGGTVTIPGNVWIGGDSEVPGALYIHDNSTTSYTLGIIGTGTRTYEFRGSSSGADYETSFTNPSSGGHNVTVNGTITATHATDSSIIAKVSNTSGTRDAYLKFNDGLGTEGKIRYNHYNKFLEINNTETNGWLQFSTENTERMRIDCEGNVGIGNTAPSAWHSDHRSLQLGAGGSGVSGGGSTYRNISLNQNTYLDSSGDWVYVGSDYAGRIEGYDGTWRFAVAPSGTGGNDITGFKTGIYIGNDANVGIQNSSLENWHDTFAVLQIGGGGSVMSHVAQTAGTSIHISNNAYYDSNHARWEYISTGASDEASNYYQANGNHYFRTQGADSGDNPINFKTAFQIRENGDISFYDDDGTTEGMRWDASSDGLFVGAAVTDTVNVGGGDANVVTDESFGINNGSNQANYKLDRINFNSGNYYVLNESSAGVKLVNTATSWTTQSDERLKENIIELTDVLPKVKDMRCVTYNLKSQSADSKKIGFIAQDWQGDFGQVIDNEEDDTLGIRYTETIPVLLKAIQELAADNVSLKARIEALENN